MKDLQNSGFVDNRWISQKQDDLNVKYNEAMIAIDEWAYYWVLNEVNQTGTSLAEYNIYKTKMDNLIGDIAGIQRILKKASVKNEDRINELNQTIGVFTDENIGLKVKKPCHKRTPQKCPKGPPQGKLGESASHQIEIRMV